MVFFPFTINKSKIGFRDNKHRVYIFKEKEASPPTGPTGVIELIEGNVYKGELTSALKIRHKVNEQNPD